MRIVFMGTPAFAVPSLQILLNAGHDIVGVITSTDKFGGRGKSQLIESDVKKFALQENLNILQPKNLKSAEFNKELKALNADIQVVVAFRMLPEMVWNMPKLGTINLHGSLLPKYRGAAPINWAIINGESKTGVSSFKLKHEIDTGDIILQEEMEIKDDDNVGTVHDRMMHLGANVIAKTINLIESGNYELQLQDQTQVCKAPKIFKDNCKIDFDKPNREVYNFIRGLSPYPASWTMLNETDEIKIYDAVMINEANSEVPGKMVTDNKTYLRFATKDGWIEVKTLQMSGKRKMDIKSFLNGIQLVH